jgi:uncharacterized membrane protein
MMRGTYLENGILALATFVTGIMAGFFYTYTFNINLAMMQVDGATYATMQSLFNENVRHFVFFIFFFGGAAVPVLTLLVNWRHRKTFPFWLIVAAGVLYFLGIVIFTANVNLPLNYYTESWTPQALPADWMATRDAWNSANALRVLLASTSFFLYLIALVLRASMPGPLTTGQDRLQVMESLH